MDSNYRNDPIIMSSDYYFSPPKESTDPSIGSINILLYQT